METVLPLVSIVMPAYNTERFARQAIEGIEAQTYPNIELIIIDDCSPDGTAAEIERALKNFTRQVRFIRRPKNMGLATGYNDAIGMATGDYITQVDSDDVLPPNSVKDRVEFFEANPTVDFVHTDIQMIDIDGQLLFRNGASDWATEVYEEMARFKRDRPTDFFAYRLRHGLIIQANTVMFRKRAKVICTTYAQLSLVLDNDMWFRTQLRYEWGFLDKVTLHYRLHTNNTKHQYATDKLPQEYARQMSELYERLYDDICTLSSTPDLTHKKQLVLCAGYYWWIISGSRYETLARRTVFLSSYYPPFFRFRLFVKAVLKVFFKVKLRYTTQYK
jgi:glycosyltransferase involved in cell wall biosynthesis